MDYITKENKDRQNKINKLGLRGKDIRSKVIPLIRIIILIILMGIFGITSDAFLSIPNILNILRQSSVLLLLALGMTFVMINQGIDLSVAGVMTACACFCGVLIRGGVPIPVAMTLSILMGFSLGAVSGAIVGYIGLPPFVATYGILWISNGLSLALMQGQIIFGFPSAFRFFGGGHILGFIPVIVIISMGVCILGHLLLTKTIFGQYVYAMGGNMTAAMYSGIKIQRMRVLVFAFSGSTAAIAGLLQASRLNAAEVAMGGNFLMLSIAAVMIGGARRLGGEGGVGGTIIGALLLTTAVNGMNLLGVPAEAHPLIIGLVVIFSIFLNDFMVQFARK